MKIIIRFVHGIRKDTVKGASRPQREFGTGPENHSRMKIDLLFFISPTIQNTALNAVFRFCNQLSGVRSAISNISMSH